MKYKCVAISDTHNRLHKIAVPPCDILFHAGDWTMMGTKDEVEKFFSQMENMPAKHKVVIAGNHDWLAEKDRATVEAIALNHHVYYLQDKMITLNGLNIYGAPWQPWFCDWAFNVERGPDIEEKWANIPKGLDVLMTHGPPEGILDIPGGERRRVGCYDLFNRVMQVKPKVHIFGHIHGSYGEKFFEGVHFINASCVGEDYLPTNRPIEFELEVDAL
jgi:Icc-related predicted phosphoesterase